MQNDTMTNMTDQLPQIPKLLGPAGHAVMDYMTAGTLLCAGFALRGRHSRASTLAFVNGAAVLGLSLMTDYPGGVFRKISFKTHGVIDAVQAVMMAAGPALMGFSKDPEATLFHGQAALEAGVMAATDWDSQPDWA